MIMKNKKIAMAGISGLLAAGLIMGSVEYASHTFVNTHTLVAEEQQMEQKEKGGDKTEDAVSKEETVYVNLKPSGEVDKVIVSDWLKSAGTNGEVKDYSELSDIENVKGDESFSQSGKELTWSAADKDIYYQGTTDKELPVNVKFTYKLDGREVTPEELAGKSGKLEMTVKYENNEKMEVDGNDGKKEVYVPFVMVTGMMLPVDNFENVEIDHGKVVSEGSNAIAVGVGFPGLPESLDVSEDASEEIPDGFTLTADVKDFKLETTLTYAAADILGQMNFDDAEDLDDIVDDLEELTDASAKLVTGSGDLYDGVSELQKKMGEYADGIDTLTDGIDTLSNGGEQLMAGLTTYTEGVKTLAKGSGEYVDGAVTLADGVKSYVEGGETLYAGIAQLYEKTKNLPGQYAKLSAGIQAYVEGVNQLADKDNLAQLAGGSAAVSNGIGTVHAGAAAIKGGVAQVNENLGTLEQTFAYNDSAMQTLQALLNDNSLTDDQKQAIQTALGTMDTATKTQKQIVTGLKTATDTGAGTTAELGAGINSLVSATAADSSLQTGASAVSSALSAFQSGGGTLTGSNESLLAGNKEMEAGIKSLSAAIKTLNEGAVKLKKNDKKLTDGAAKLTKSGKQIKKGAKKLTKNTKKLTGAGNLLEDGVRELMAGGRKVSKATNLLKEGVDKLTDGSRELKDGMSAFDKDGIAKIKETYDDKVASLFDNLDAVRNASKEYQTFSGLGDGMDGKVKFIYETSAIKAEDKK